MPTKCNPADLLSRGCDVNELRDSIWFEGSVFLLQKSAVLTEEQESLEKRKSNVFFALERPKKILLIFIERFSSYKKMLRVMSYVLRFLDGARKRKNSKSAYPTATEFILVSFIN